MPSWSEIVKNVEAYGTNNLKIDQYLNMTLEESLDNISKKRNNKNVIFYSSAFLQKPQLDPMIHQITYEEINGFMAVMHTMDFSKGLVLVLHTPGGITTAAEAIVEYLHSKFSYIETIIPTYALSAGTMIALSSDLIIMGRPSQLGPIDTQMPVNGRIVSAKSIVDQFEKAKAEINDNIINAHVWAPILGSMSPGLIIEAQKANDYGEEIVAGWLKRKNYSNFNDIAAYFNSPALHKSHAKRIDRTEAINQGLRVEELEADQELQEAVLTAYHILTILFEKSPAAKIIVANNKKRWIKNHAIQHINLPFPIPNMIPKRPANNI